MRNAIFTLLKDDPQIQELGIKKIYAAPGMDTPKEDFFIVLRWIQKNAEFGLVGTDDLEIWVHKRDADYFSIIKVLNRIKVLMTITTHRQGSDGVFRQAKWTGDSGDNRDDGFRTYTKNSGYRCNGGFGAEQI